MDALRSIAFVISVCLICLCVPIAIYLSSKYPDYTEWVEIAAGAVVLALSAVAGWRLKRGLKGRMQRGLGREVMDSELTSITAWMKIPDQAARASKEAEKYDFDSK